MTSLFLKMEGNLIILYMEDNPTNLGNGRQPQSFRQFKSLENGTELHFFPN